MYAKWKKVCIIILYWSQFIIAVLYSKKLFASMDTSAELFMVIVVRIIDTLKAIDDSII